MEDLAKNMALFKDSEGWKQILSSLNKSIEDREAILLWDTNPNTLDWDMNKLQFNKYDLLRLERNLLKGLKELPDDIIRYNDPIIEVPKQG